MDEIELGENDGERASQATGVGDDNGDVPFDTATLGPRTTGLPFAVCISTVVGTHDVRVKVSRDPNFPDDQTAIIGLRPAIHWVSGMHLEAKDFDLVMRWIDLNYDTIVAFWNREIE